MLLAPAIKRGKAMHLVEQVPVPPPEAIDAMLVSVGLVAGLRLEAWVWFGAGEVPAVSAGPQPTITSAPLGL